MFKLLFGLDKYSHYNYKYRTTTASWRAMKMVNKVCAGHWKMTPGLPGLASIMNVGLAVIPE